MGIKFSTALMAVFLFSGAMLWWFAPVDSWWQPFGIAFGVIGSGLVFALGPQADWWFALRNPPQLTVGEVRMLTAEIEYFRRLAISEKTRFGTRLKMVLMDKQYQLAATDDKVPAELTMLTAAAIVQFTFGLERDYWIDALEKIILYPLRFPTLERTTWHACEAHPDGCILLSAEALKLGSRDTAAYYNVALHAVAEFWALKHPHETAAFEATLDGSFTEQLLSARLFTDGFWVGITGIDTPQRFPMAVETFFAQPARMRAAMPDTFERLCTLLGQNPLGETYPRGGVTLTTNA